MVTETDGTESVQDLGSLWPVFLCYRQSDGRRVAERLFALLSGLIIQAGEIGYAAGDHSQLDIYFDQTAPGVADWTMVHEPYLKRARAFIVVCTPGAKLIEGDRDWVHREIAWWIQNRGEAPILIDALGEGERYVPKAIADKWPNAQRINIVLEEWDQLSREDLEALEQRTRARILGGITHSVGSIYRQELEREQERTRELSEAFAAQKRLSASLKRSFLAITVLFLLAAVAAGYASWQRHIAEDRQMSALSGKLAAVSLSLADRSHFQLDTAALLTVEGLRRRASPQLMDTAQQLLSSMLKPLPMFADTHSWKSFAVSPDGSIVATTEAVGDSDVVVVRAMPSGEERARTKLPKQFPRCKLSFDPTVKHLIIVGSKDAWVWNWTTPGPMNLPRLGQRQIVVSRSGRWLAGLNEEGIQIYDLNGEYPHRVLPAGEDPWMHQIAFGSTSDDTLLLARNDEPGFVSLIQLPEGSAQKRFFATRRERQMDPNTPIMDALGFGTPKFIERGVEVGSLLVSADGCTLAVVEGRFIVYPGAEWQTHLWNICGKPRHITTIVNRSQVEWAISADGKFLAGGDEDGKVSVYSLPKGGAVASRVLGPRISNVAISADGRRVTSTHNGDTAIVWDWESNEIIGRASAETELQAIAQGGGWLFGLTYQDSLHAWKIPPKVDQARLMFRGELQGVATASAGDAALAWTDETEAILWRPSVGKVIRNFKARIGSAELSDNGDRVLILTTHLYVLAGGEKKLDIELPMGYEEVRDNDGRLSRWVKAEPNQRTFADAVTDEDVPRRDLSSRSERFQRESITRRVYWSKAAPAGWGSQSNAKRGRGSISHCAAIRGDGKEVAVSILDWVFRYDVDTGERTGRVALGYVNKPPDAPMFERGEQDARVEELSYDSSGALWITTGTHELWHWDKDVLKLVKGRQIVAKAGHTLAFQIGADSQNVAVYGNGIAGKPIHLKGTLSSVSTDGKYLATTEESKKLAVEVIGGHNPGVFNLDLIRADTGKRSWMSRHMGAQAAQVVFSPDGSYIAMGDQEGVVRVWRATDGVEVNRLSVKGAITHLNFTHDSSAILVAGEQAPRTLIIAPMAVKYLINELCSLLTHDLSPAEWEEYMKGEPWRSTCTRHP